jgi:hypothetical protein
MTVLAEYTRGQGEARKVAGCGGRIPDRNNAIRDVTRAFVQQYTKENSGELQSTTNVTIVLTTVIIFMRETLGV